MSVLHGATNVTINGGQFIAVSSAGSMGPGSTKDIVSVLLSHSATAGLLDAAERFDAPKCDEGTRVSMQHEMRTFVQRRGGSAVYWLHGPAGVGKSALAQTLALLLKNEGDHAASFFFSRTAPGRSDGGQLIVTLACQLALHIPPLQPILAKVIGTNPLIFNATNMIKMQELIVNPLNQLHQSFRRKPRYWASRLAKRKLHPRLILVDGLDECNDPRVQEDLLLCIAFAARHLLLPFRFIIASRPESHILATFELNQAFQGPHCVHLTSQDLGKDEDADGQITAFLVKEFEEIRRTHPIRDFLPEQWPLAKHITQLVSKSSKGFIYAATVIRYIKMPNNRPDECLERILGLSETPFEDKPYEPLDALYHYIFESVPKSNKDAVRSIFHFLVVPSDLSDHITPRHIETHLSYKPGHVHHVLRDLLCIVSFSDQHVRVLHASLPDFLLDRSRSGPLWINAGDAHATLAASFHRDCVSSTNLASHSGLFDIFLGHFQQARLTKTLLQTLAHFDLAGEYQNFSDTMDRSGNRQQKRVPMPFLTGITSVVVYLLLVSAQDDLASLVSKHIEALKAYAVKKCALGSAFAAVEGDIRHVTVPKLATSTIIHKSAIQRRILASSLSDSSLGEDISRLQLLLFAAAFYSHEKQGTVQFAGIPDDDFHPASARASSQLHAYIARTLVVFLLADHGTVDHQQADIGGGVLWPLACRIIAISLKHAEYSASLLAVLDHFSKQYHLSSNVQTPRALTQANCFRQLEPLIMDYLNSHYPPS